MLAAAFPAAFAKPPLAEPGATVSAAQPAMPGAAAGHGSMTPAGGVYADLTCAACAARPDRAAIVVAAVTAATPIRRLSSCASCSSYVACGHRRVS
jgi:hypothetical protein